MGDRRLHSNPEHIEFEKTHVLNVMLIEMTHPITRSATFYGSPIEQRGIGEDHSTWMHGDIPWQSIEAFDKIEEVIELPTLRELSDVRVPQLG
jgi:hypothetical protein